MKEEFRTLRDDEIEILLKAPVMVAILIAGADDNIDKYEIKEAIAFSEKKKSSEKNFLSDYFNEVGDDFEKNLELYIRDLPKEIEIRQATITSYLRQLNGILPKIEVEVAVKFYEFLLELSKVVAKASGGVMGFNKISKEEAEFLHLEMIHNPTESEYI